jgi:hypothetical protein
MRPPADADLRSAQARRELLKLRYFLSKEFPGFFDAF